MLASLFQAYTPLLFWTGMGFWLVRILPAEFPHLLGRGLYWVGVPCEIFALARQIGDLENTKLAPVIAAGSILLGLALGGISLYVCRPSSGGSAPLPNSWPPLESPGLQGSWLLCSMLGNTGFIGLSVVPFLVSSEHVVWAVFYSVTQNVFGTYGLGVLVASFYGRQVGSNRPWWELLKDLVMVPSLWGFLLGFTTRQLPFPTVVENGLQGSVWVVIAGAFLLMGMRLSQIAGWQSLQLALLPALLKTIVMPGILGLVLLVLDIPQPARLALVVMAGVPSAFAALILAEEYNLDRDLVASSIINSTGIFLLVLPIWIYLFS
jgi:malate permease and related proteins